MKRDDDKRDCAGNGVEIPLRIFFDVCLVLLKTIAGQRRSLIWVLVVGFIVVVVTDLNEK